MADYYRIPEQIISVIIPVSGMITEIIIPGGIIIVIIIPGGIIIVIIIPGGVIMRILHIMNEKNFHLWVEFTTKFLC